jgi:hypothetical protein
MRAGIEMRSVTNARIASTDHAMLSEMGTNVLAQMYISKKSPD